MELRTSPRNPYSTKSLNTLDIDTAKSKALAWERTLFARIDNGKPIHAIPFDKMANAYLVSIDQRSEIFNKNGRPLVAKSAVIRAKTVINRYLIPYFRNMDVNDIKNSNCNRYLFWRQNYYIDGPGATEELIEFARDGKKLKRPSQKNVDPSPSTIAKDAVTFNQILKYAANKYDLSYDVLPKIKSPTPDSHKETRRPRFTDDKLELLFNTHDDRLKEQYGRNRFFNEVLWGLMQLLLGTGIRVSEAMWLQIKHIEFVKIDPRDTRYAEIWRDFVSHGEEGEFLNPPFIEEDRKQYRIRIAKDNPGLKRIDQNRTVIPTRFFTEKFRNHLEFVQGHFEKCHDVKLDSYWDLPLEQYLFIDQDCSKVQSLGNGFNALLRGCVSEVYHDGLKKVDGESYSLSCFRPTYASQQIEAGATANGLGFLADNMGTSPEMIRRHYGQIMNERHAKELQKI
ncbi:MAG: hypothetical protein COA52_17345 [Hyphomicrobiales bacterium]|nr:MAG: hypothetical protein COA52_17345 [Hyphomicrobiales bacterium]